MSRFTAEHKWPVSIATLDVDTMRIRAGTYQESPFSTSVDQARMARRVPMLTSALGRAYLAFCPADERETILKLLRASSRSVDSLARDRDTITALLDEIHRQGYAPSPTLRGETAVGFALPVLMRDRVVACITLRYFGKALSEQQVARRYLRSLRETAAAIADGARSQETELMLRRHVD